MSNSSKTPGICEIMDSINSAMAHQTVCVNNTSSWNMSSDTNETVGNSSDWNPSTSASQDSEERGSGWFISPEAYQTAEKVIECGFMPAVSLVGVPANIINLVVFFRQGLRDQMNLCLFSLAFVDLMYVTCMFLSTWYCAAAFLSKLSLEQILKWYIRKYVINFVYAFWYSSGTLTSIIATERCLCVAVPMKFATVLTTKVMGGLIVGSVVLINLLCLTYVLKHSVGWEGCNKTGTVKVVLKDTQLFLDNRPSFDIITDNILPFISFSTFFVVIVVTFVTVKKLKKAITWRQNVSCTSADRRQVALVKMLVIVSFIYIACNIPQLSLAIVRFLLEGFSTSGKYRKMFFITHRAGHVLLMMNSSVNMFVYYRQSSRFRKEVMKMCARRSCCCFEAQRKGSGTEISSIN